MNPFRASSTTVDASYASRLDQLFSSRDPRLPPHRFFQGVDDDFWFWMHTEGCRRSPRLAEILPALPDPTTSARFVGSSGDEALQLGFAMYKFYKEAFERYVGPIGDCASVLDSGCGWGRVIRFWLKDLDPARVWGADPLPEALDICRATNRWCRFEAIDYLPPTGIPDGTFDLVYLLSVFSHLSEPAHQRWLTEYHRLLRPGGLLIATTWHSGFIHWVEKVRRDPNEPCTPDHWRDCMKDIFVDTEKTLADYDAGKFCFGEFNQNKMQSFLCEGINSYGDACIPKGYVEKHWADRFELLEFVEDLSYCGQNIIVAKRK